MNTSKKSLVVIAAALLGTGCAGTMPDASYVRAGRSYHESTSAEYLDLAATSGRYTPEQLSQKRDKVRAFDLATTSAERALGIVPVSPVGDNQ